MIYQFTIENMWTIPYNEIWSNNKMMARTFNDFTLMEFVYKGERWSLENQMKYIKVASFNESMEFLLDVM